MKKKYCVLTFLVLSVVAATAAVFSTTQAPMPADDYQLVWQEDFNGRKLDTTHWTIIERGPSAWQKYMSSNSSLYELRNGRMRLYARRNKNIEPNDTAPYLTGGICTQHKLTFTYGKIEVRARIKGAEGCWPAIWLKSDDPKLWGYPERAEIDIMEYASHKEYVTQTVHSNYTDVLKHTDNPQMTSWPKPEVGLWNVYGVEIRPDRVLLTVNGEVTLNYPRIATNEVGQFPYGVESFLLIDMQVGNQWLTNIVASEYPAWMDIDWVKVYKMK